MRPIEGSGPDNPLRATMMATAEDPKSAKREHDFKHLRRPSEKDDFELNAQAQVLLASIAPEHRPNELAQLFPRIVNRMTTLWRHPVQMEGLSI
jgi:hypothetical protein